MEALKNLNSQVNTKLGGYQPTSIILGTLSAYYALQIAKEIVNEGPKEFITKKLLKVFRVMKKIPLAAGAIEKEKGKLLGNVTNIFPNVPNVDVQKELPAEGMKTEDLYQLLKQISDNESEKIEKGQVSGGIYIGDEKHKDLLCKAYSLFFHVNPLHPDLFPSGRKFESEIINMTLRLLGGNEQNGGCGVVTSGGTESIIMALKAYRDHAKEIKGIEHPEIIISNTAHAAFNKGCHYFGIKLISLPVDHTTGYNLTAAAVEKRITRNTVCIVGSAPNYPYGTIDHIADLSKLAVKYNIGLHVDCCLGGFVLPFAKMLKYDIPEFDFTLPGVTTISADTHKFGLASKGSSVLLFKSKQLRNFMYFCAPTWPGGIYMSPSMAGSRPGALLATCWTSLMHLGKKGLMDSTERIMKTVLAIKEGVLKMKDIQLLGEPVAMIVAFKSDTVNVFMVSDAMGERGWSLNALQYPNGVHICITPRNAGKAEQFLKDLQEAIDEVKAHPEKFKHGLAPVYGAAVAVPDKSIVVEISNGVLDAMLDLPQAQANAQH